MLYLMLYDVTRAGEQSPSRVISAINARHGAPEAAVMSISLTHPHAIAP
jgi:hypothetical protein